MTLRPWTAGRAGRLPVARLRVVGWGLYAVYAVLLATLTTLSTHRVWGAAAAVGYGLAALLAAGRARLPQWLPGAVAALGSTAVPLVLLGTGRAQSEVRVVEGAAALLLRTGSPYVPEPGQLSEYNPYLPGMTVFGLPRALFGDAAWTDARWWFAAGFTAAAFAAIRVMRTPVRDHPGAPGEPPGRPAGSLPVLLRVLACPVVALPLAVGGIDLPVVGLVCLGLAHAGRAQAGRAGVFLGLAAVLKWTAWPAVPVAVALLAAGAVHRRCTALPGVDAPAGGSGERDGTRAVLRCLAATTGIAAAVVLPVAVADGAALFRHAVLFPLGMTDVPSPAASPLPGRLLASASPVGATVALLVLAVAALVMAASLVVRPPLTASAAAARLALGLSLAFCLAPATRFGYFVYPLVLLMCCRPGRPEARRASLPVLRGPRAARPSHGSDLPATVRV
ncbi:glycosyltransferase 87 family protein [Streptomyces sp. AS02]|uniref:glycosyltransferase 87 family protein n=1 Tax=Streptomyces sp. AS02 TaxID=2938946 RepID=UPI00202281F7|nr:glycosyltransferase 87 family protein [Streptomyces sp. AS02]MCL8015955.1 glycosyltransferase 87 family protein [Streptomyces sp. AS02]